MHNVKFRYIGILLQESWSIKDMQRGSDAAQARY